MKERNASLADIAARYKISRTRAGQILMRAGYSVGERDVERHREPLPPVPG
jgi:hypothetical protein